jgi:Peptidase A4 family
VSATVRLPNYAGTAPTSWAKRRALWLSGAALLAAALLAGFSARPASAAAATATSSNWAGYAASGASFRKVSANWTVPTSTCTAGRDTYSAVWVGLGGFETSSNGLEQTGIDANCSSTGRASYSAWYEILPASARTVRSLKVSAGDRISASVTVSGYDVRFRVRNLTTGGDYTTTKHVSSPDVSSADWIVEAPSSCTSSNDCQTLPLSNFGKVSFTHASATTTGGKTGTISSSRWTTTKITLGQTSRFVARDGSAAAGATPSSLSSGGSVFSVSYDETSPSTGGSEPVTFPGGPGGPP